ncbi:MAG: hypothetical protein JOZ16_09930 [Methylobacteriaceae bacterium]|nr:hypothetical protein [Methylobacteriaceae bacterium]
MLVYRPVGSGRSSNSKWLKLASYSHVPSVAEARRLARIALGRIAAGADPAAERAEQKRRSQARVAELLDAYERDLGQRKYVNRKIVMNSLRSRLRKYLTRDIRDLSGAELARIIEGLKSAGKPGAAEDFRSRCRAFLTYCVTKAKVLPISPLAGYRKERATRADRLQAGQRGRSLPDIELARLWAAADPAVTFGRAVRFLILTGCRRGEAALLTWPMISPEEKLIRFPAESLKQGRDHVMPIAPALEDVLDACNVDARSDLVFASPKTGGRISARGKLEAIYNRDDAVAQLRKAFELWADHVSRIVLSKPSKAAAE